MSSEKETLRKEIRGRIARVSAERRSELARAAAERLLSREVWAQARSVLGYLGLRDELDLRIALEAAQAAGKRVAFPRYVPTAGAYCAAVPSREGSLTQGAFGVREPHPNDPVLPLNQLDLVLVPGVAFDPWGRRLGRGKGFYDRLLAQVNGIKCGVALDEQIVEQLPTEAHDIGVDVILTPSRWLIVPPVGT